MKNSFLMFLLCFLGGGILNAQTITSVTPAQNPIIEGDTLMINIVGNNTNFTQNSFTYISIDTGGNFIADAVIIGGTNTSIDALFYLPCGAYGNVTLNVTTPMDGLMSFPNAFNIMSSDITSITPNTANAGQTLNIDISGIGLNFGGTNSIVYLQHDNSTQTIYPSSYNGGTANNTNVTFNIPSSACGDTYSVCTYNKNGCLICLPSALYINGSQGQISIVSPDTAIAGQPLDIGISGTGLNFVQDSVTVFLHGTTSGQYFYLDTSYYTVFTDSINVYATIPNSICADEYFDVCVYKSNSYCTICISNGLFVQAAPINLQIDTVSPSTIQGGQYFSLDITSSVIDFQNTSGSLSFELTDPISGDTVEHYQYNVLLSNLIRVYFPPLACGSYDLRIYGADPCSGNSVVYNNAVTVNTTLSPYFYNVSPNAGMAAQPLTLDVYATSLNFGQTSPSISARLVHVVTGAVITGSNIVVLNPLYPNHATIDFYPSITDCGLYNLEIMNALNGCGGTSTFTHTNAVVINNPSNPQIQTISRDTATAGQTISFTISTLSVDFTTVSPANVYLHNNQLGDIIALNLVPNVSSPNEAVVTFYLPDNNICGKYDLVIDSVPNCNLNSVVLLDGFDVFCFVIIGTTSIDKTELEVKVYPNPMDNQATVQITSEKNQTWTFVMYDMLGQMIKYEQVESNSSFTLERQNIPSGIYIYRLMDNNGNPLKTGKIEMR